MSRLCAGIYAFFLILFGLLCYLAHQFLYFPGDIGISLWLQGIDLPLLNPIMQAVSYISSSIPKIITVALVAGGLWASGRKLEPIFIASLTSSAALLNWLLKLLISRPRPGSELIQIMVQSNGFSFPSGHVTSAVVFYSFVFYLAPRLIKQPVATGALRSLLILLILLTGASRVYLGAHWPSDVLGSFLLGGLLLVPAITLYHNYATGHQKEVGDKDA